MRKKGISWGDPRGAGRLSCKGGWGGKKSFHRRGDSSLQEEWLSTLRGMEMSLLPGAGET